MLAAAAPAPFHSDDVFLRSFEACTLPVERFGHREHLRVAWLYLRRFAYEEAVTKMAGQVRKYVAANGVPHKYHHTLTVLWMRLIAGAIARDPREDFDDFLRTHPHLLHKSTPGRHYSASRLQSAAARAGWVEPDLHPLP
ncbi:MAG TPA: hypothetical protein VF193_16455 [Steroidobacter sp.]